MEHTAIAPTGLLSRAPVLLQDNDTDRPGSVSKAQFPGEGAPNNPGTYNTDVIRVHLVWPVGSKDRRRSVA